MNSTNGSEMFSDLIINNRIGFLGSIFLDYNSDFFTFFQIMHTFHPKNVSLIITQVAIVYRHSTPPGCGRLNKQFL